MSTIVPILVYMGNLKLVFTVTQKQRLQSLERRVSAKKIKTLHCKIQQAVNTFMACRISFMPAEKTSNGLQRLLNEL